MKKHVFDELKQKNHAAYRAKVKRNNALRARYHVAASDMPPKWQTRVPNREMRRRVHHKHSEAGKQRRRRYPRFDPLWKKPDVPASGV